MRWLTVMLALLLLAGLGCGSGVVHTSSTASITPPSTSTQSTQVAVTSESTTTASSVAAHNTWTNLSPSGSLPAVRAGHSLIYDVARDQVIMFGGLDETKGTNTPLNDTWAYDPGANTWTNLNPAGTQPPVRMGQSVVYDSSTRSLIMFGGQANSGLANDTWAFDPAANSWTNLNPTGTLPAARAWFKMVYDSDTGKVVMFGGMADGADANDTWAYDPTANNWAKLSPTGALPSARDSFSMTYDPSTKRVIMFGGVEGSGELNETWAYDPAANAWTKLSPTGTPPQPRYGAAMAYDSDTHRVLLFGGEYGDNGSLSDTWAYDPGANTWTNLNPAGTLPLARSSSMVYDSTRRQVIMFGGNDSSSGFNDTWSYTP